MQMVIVFSEQLSPTKPSVPPFLTLPQLQITATALLHCLEMFSKYSSESESKLTCRETLDGWQEQSWG